MIRRTFAFVVCIAALVAADTVPGYGTEVVDILLRGRYFTEPATVRVMVTVEPDAQNRALRIEADGDDLFRASELTLTGASCRRFHSMEFKNLPAGQYTIRAQVLSAHGVRAMAEQRLLVVGGPGQR